MDWWTRSSTMIAAGLRARSAFLPAEPWDANTRLWLPGGARRLSALLLRRRSATSTASAGRRAAGPFDLQPSPSAPTGRQNMRSRTRAREAVQAFEDLHGRILLGIHWGTFDLSEEPLGEPPERMLAEVSRRGIPPERAWILKIGETRHW